MRRRYRYDVDPETGHVTEVEMGARPEAEAHVQILTDGAYDGLRATDGTPIDTRARHRAYMQTKGLAMAEDYTQHWAESQKSRDAWFKEGGDWRVQKQRQADIAQAASESYGRKFEAERPLRERRERAWAEASKRR